ncbi:MAG: hsp [Myxococcaceae bacterium]|nr:hsp [Myxococcaceae bacterium]
MLSIWDSFADLPRIQREFERTLQGARSRGPEFAPAVDVQEDSEAVSLNAELPGVKREDIEIQVDGNVLTLRGERKPPQQAEQGQRFQRVERAYGTFVRQFQLPTNLDSSQIDAQLVDGVLTVRLPKKQEQKPRKIEVRSGPAPVSSGAAS